MQKLVSWLTRIGLEQHAELLIENDISFDLLPEITELDLKELGFSIGHRRKLLAAIKALSTPDTDEYPSADTSNGETWAATSEAGIDQVEHRQLTVLFCDLVGSTNLSQTLSNEELREVMLGYQSACKEAIERHKGFVAKYMGDGLLAYFGYPQAHEDDAKLAVSAGLAIVEMIQVHDQQSRPDKNVSLAVRVGISTGSVIVGDLIGEGASREYGVVGETLNLAARLESLAEPDTVVISPSTHNLVKSFFKHHYLGPQNIKGFDDPVEAWRIDGAILSNSNFGTDAQKNITPLIGRKEEAETLIRRWDLSRQGRGQVIFLSGEPGIGKSRLIQHLIENSASDKQLRLRYQCSEHHTNSALFPYLAQIEYASGFVYTDSNTQKLDKIVTTLKQMGDDNQMHVTLLASLLSISTGDLYPSYEGDPKGQRLATLKMLQTQFDLLASTKPILFMFEDIHWIDPSSLELLDRLVERISELPVMLVLTFRPNFNCPWIGLAHSTYMSLSRMHKEDILQMIEEMTAGKHFSDEFIEHVISRTDGVPLFVEELTKVLLEGDSGDNRNKGNGTDSQSPSTRPPETLQDSLTARLDRLGPAAKSVAQTCSVTGRSISYRLLSRITDIRPEHLDQALGKLVKVDLMSCRGQLPHSTYTFKHALIQDTAYQSMLSARRIVIHGQIADALYEHFPEEVKNKPEVVAYHYLMAERPQLALDHFEKAATRTLARSNYAEGINHLNQALKIIEAMPESAQRDEREIGIQSALGGAMIATKGFAAQETGDTYARAAELYKRIDGDTSRFNPVRYGVWVFHLVRSDFDTAFELADECMKVAENQSNPTQHLIAHRTMGSCLTFMGQWETAIEHQQKVLSLYDPDLHHSLAVAYTSDPKIAALALKSWSLLHIGRIDDAIKVSETAVEDALAFQHLHTTALTLGLGGIMLHQFLGDLKLTRKLADTLVEICSSQPVPLWSNLASCIQGWAIGMAGQTEKGINQILAGYKGFSATGARLFLPYYGSLKAEVYVKAGQHDKAIECLEEAQLRLESNPEGWFICDFHRIYGDLCHKMNLIPRADAAYHTGLKLANSHGDLFNQLRCTMGLAEIAQTSLEKQSVYYKLDETYRQFKQGKDSEDLIRARRILAAIHPKEHREERRPENH